MRPKVLHVITGLHTGGAESMLHKLLVPKEPRHWEACVVSLTDGGKYWRLLEDAGIKVVGLHMRRGFPTVTALIRLSRIINEFQPDLIQGWMYHGNLLATLFKRRHRPVLWNVRQSLKDLSKEKLLTRAVIRLCALLSPLADGIIYNSEAGARDHERFGFATARATLIRNGFDLERFKPNLAARQKWRSAWGISHETRLIGTIGRFDPHKDYPTFLKAAKLTTEGRPNLKFALVGNGLTADNAELRGWIDRAGLRDQLILPGEVEAPEAILNAFDVFVLSSSSEGFPNVVGEAMAAGLTCVATDVGDARLVVGDQGIVCPPNDPEALAGGLQRALAKLTTSPNSGSLARERIAQHFSIDRIVAQYEDLYSSTSREPRWHNQPEPDQSV